jgi:hypothetical protein
MGIETAILGAGALGAGASLFGSSKAAKAQQEAANQANATQLQMYNQQRADLAPYAAAGLEAQNQLRSYLGLGGDTSAPGYGKYAGDFGTSDFTADPGYAFRLSEGLKGLNAQAAARGGMISGAALKAAENYGQQAGSQEYQNAFNRYQTNRTNQLAPLQSLMGSGQASAAGQAAAAGNYGTAAAQNLANAGQAQASGYVGATNAINQGLTQGISQYQTNSLLNRLGGGGVSQYSNPMANFVGTGNSYAYGSGGYTGAGPYQP